MAYKILEAKIVFEKEELKKVTILVDMSISTMPLNDVRVIESTNQPRPVYHFLLPGDILSPALLQKIAGYGVQVTDPHYMEALFPNWKNRHK